MFVLLHRKVAVVALQQRQALPCSDLVRFWQSRVVAVLAIWVIETIPGWQVHDDCKGVRRFWNRRHGHRLHPSRERAAQVHLRW